MFITKGVIKTFIQEIIVEIINTILAEISKNKTSDTQSNNT
jgi:hypothetical protein